MAGQKLCHIHLDIMDKDDECGTTNIFDPARGGTRPPLPSELASRGVAADDWDGVVDALIGFQQTEPFYACPALRNWLICFPGFVAQYLACLPFLVCLYWGREIKLAGQFPPVDLSARELTEKIPGFIGKINGHLRGLATVRWSSSFDTNKGLNVYAMGATAAARSYAPPAQAMTAGVPVAQGFVVGGGGGIEMELAALRAENAQLRAGANLATAEPVGYGAAAAKSAAATPPYSTTSSGGAASAAEVIPMTTTAPAQVAYSSAASAPVLGTMPLGTMPLGGSSSGGAILL